MPEEQISRRVAHLVDIAGAAADADDWPAAARLAAEALALDPENRDATALLRAAEYLMTPEAQEQGESHRIQFTADVSVSYPGGLSPSEAAEAEDEETEN